MPGEAMHHADARMPKLSPRTGAAPAFHSISRDFDRLTRHQVGRARHGIQHEPPLIGERRGAE